MERVVSKRNWLLYPNRYFKEGKQGVTFRGKVKWEVEIKEVSRETPKDGTV